MKLDSEEFLAAIDQWCHNEGRPLNSILSECSQLPPEECEEVFSTFEDCLSSTRDDSEGIAVRKMLAKANLRNRYQRIRPVSHGGFGVIWSAIDEFGRLVALKELREDCTEYRAQFELEATVTASLEHPNIPPVFARGPDEHGRFFYTMRFVKGDNLWDSIHSLHRSNFPQALSDGRLNELLRQFCSICDAISFAHTRHRLHCDLKPENIQLDASGEPIVLDWGLTRPGTIPSNKMITDAIQISETSPYGSPSYMSPEQANGIPPDELTDVFGLGTVLYSVLTDNPPYVERTRADAVKRAAKADFPSPRQVQRDVPRALEKVCLKAMHADPKKRYQSAAAVGDDVKRYLDGNAVQAWEGKEPIPYRVWRWVTFHRTLVTVLGGLLLSWAILLSVYTIKRVTEREHLWVQYRNAIKALKEDSSQDKWNWFRQADLIVCALTSMGAETAKLKHEVDFWEGVVKEQAGELAEAEAKYTDAIEATISLDDDLLKSKYYTARARVRHEKQDDVKAEADFRRAFHLRYPPPAPEELDDESVQRKRLYYNSLANLGHFLNTKGLRQSISAPTDTLPPNDAQTCFRMANSGFDHLLILVAPELKAEVLRDAAKCRMNSAMLNDDLGRQDDARKEATEALKHFDELEAMPGSHFSAEEFYLHGHACLLLGRANKRSLPHYEPNDVLVDWYVPALARLRVATLICPSAFRYKETLAVCQVETSKLYAESGRKDCASKHLRAAYAFFTLDKSCKPLLVGRPTTRFNAAWAIFNYLDQMEPESSNDGSEAMIDLGLKFLEGIKEDDDVKDVRGGLKALRDHFD